MNEFVKNNTWSILGVVFTAGFLYCQLQGVKIEEDTLSQDVHIVNNSIAQLNTDVKVLDARTTRDEKDIQAVNDRVNRLEK